MKKVTIFIKIFFPKSQERLKLEDSSNIIIPKNWFYNFTSTYLLKVNIRNT